MNVPDHYRNLAARRVTPPRAAYILAVSCALGVVTFTLVYLTTLSLVSG